MTRWPAALLLVAVVAGIGLWIAQCSGPRPALVGEPVIHAPETPAEPYRVVATIQNTGQGHGEVQVTFRLRDPRGLTYETTRAIELARGETARVTGRIDAPTDTYAAEVEVAYPPG